MAAFVDRALAEGNASLAFGVGGVALFGHGWMELEWRMRGYKAKAMVLAAVWLGLPVAAIAGAPPGVSVQKPWMRYLLPNIPAGGYMVLQNSGDNPAVLTGAASAACGMLMLHESQDDSGMAMMMDVPGMIVPAHGSVSLAPGGYHLMCMQPVMKLGGKISVTLSFQGGGSLVVSMPVYGPAGAP